MDTTHEIVLSSGTVRYREDGPADGPVLLFVHGFLVDGQLWRKAIAEVSGWARCIAPDLPLGSHVLPMNDDADLSPRGVVALIAELIERLGIEGATVVANDSGGAMTQMLVTTRPELVGAVVLTSCDAFDNFPPKAFKPLVKALRGPRSVKAALAGTRVAAVRRSPVAFGWLAKHGIPDDVTLAWVQPALTDERIRRDIVKFAKGIDAEPDCMLDVAARLREFDKPVLIAWSEEDRFFPVEHGRRLAEILPQARFEAIPDAWTFVSEDQPGVLARLLEEFAGSQSAGKVPAGTSPS